MHFVATSSHSSQFVSHGSHRPPVSGKKCSVLHSHNSPPAFGSSHDVQPAIVHALQPSKQVSHSEPLKNYPTSHSHTSPLIVAPVGATHTLHYTSPDPFLVHLAHVESHNEHVNGEPKASVSS